MIEDAAAAEDHEAAPGDAPEQLQQSPIAGPVNPARPRDDDFNAGPRPRGARDGLPFHLRPLIHVARPERRVLVRRRALDVAVHADRAAMDDAPHAGRRGRFDDRADRFRVDGVIRAFRKSCLPIQRRDVVDDVDGLGRAADRAGIAKVAGN